MSSKNSKTTCCRICSKSFKSLTASHLKTHGLTLEEYELLFGRKGEEYKQCEFLSQNFMDDEYFVPRTCQLHSYNDSSSNLCPLHEEIDNKSKKYFYKCFYSLLKLFDALGTDYHLEEIIFPREFKLQIKEFNKGAFFSGSRFFSDIDFKTTFRKEAYFIKCKFYGNSNFKEVQFLGATSFNSSVFEGTVEFRRAVFMGDAGFWQCEFKDNVDFKQTRFKDRVSFGYGAFPTNPKILRFLATKFESPEQVKFVGVDLSSTLFRYTDLSKISFQNVKWALTSRIKGKRRILFDEIYIYQNHRKQDSKSKDKYYAFAKESYRQLTRNFEESRRFSEAGDFYYGEMECIRRSNFFSRYMPSLLNLYRISSGYGQRYIRSGIVLILLLFSFAVSHIFLGLQLNKPYEPKNRTIHYSFSSASKNLDKFILDIGIVISYCIEVLIREDEQDRLFRPSNIGGEILNAVFFILIYVQLLFFILALRRHFKR